MKKITHPELARNVRGSYRTVARRGYRHGVPLLGPHWIRARHWRSHRLTIGPALRPVF